VTSIILASNNSGKLQEIAKYFASMPFTLELQSLYQVPEIAETGLTFVENAILKARNATAYTQKPALADDSGLEVDALNGAPGIYSARYAGAQATDQKNIQKLLQDLENFPEEQRSARFQCVLVLMRSPYDPTPIICQGTWEGRILTQPAGSNGFGYDPIFYVPTHHCTAAELPLEEKNQISHRAQALEKLKTYLSSYSTFP
jgi:XTP/dITP diphosphohydrolase